MSSPTDRKRDAALAASANGAELRSGTKPEGEQLHVPDISVPTFLPDGRRLHRVRQSSLSETDICLERSRFEMTGTMPRVDNDAAEIGTACHAGFELCLEGILEDGVAYSLGTAREAAQHELTELMQSEHWRWVKFADEADARWFVDAVVTMWYRETLPKLRPVLLEYTFGPIVLYEDDERVVEVKGTIDYLDERMGLVDWKTGSRKHEPWQQSRWAIQPTTYTWAAVHDGLVKPDSHGIVPFHYEVFWRKATGHIEYQPYKVDRHAGDWAFLKEKALTLARLTEATYPNEGPAVLDRWPMNDNHALCSEVWCPAWSPNPETGFPGCKGAYYAKGWPKPSRPA